jgi:ribosomal protein S18 acetylase RimI-like enzyme
VTAVSVERVGAATAEVVDALARLLPQLSTSGSAPDVGPVEKLVGHPGVDLLVARVGGEIVGMLTLITFPTVTRTRAHVEDVVVDGAARGHGVGSALLREAERLARDAGAQWVDLTSRPEREAANRLYRSYGFERRETNAYRLRLDTQ